MSDFKVSIGRLGRRRFLLEVWRDGVGYVGQAEEFPAGGWIIRGNTSDVFYGDAAGALRQLGVPAAEADEAARRYREAVSR